MSIRRLFYYKRGVFSLFFCNTWYNKNMLVKAFAKVNLGLFVGNARTDGYHDVHSVVLSVDLFDLVDVEVKDANEKQQ